MSNTSFSGATSTRARSSEVSVDLTTPADKKKDEQKKEGGSLADLPILHGDEVLRVFTESGGFRSNESFSVP